jgi:hypothetical protein
MWEKGKGMKQLNKLEEDIIKFFVDNNKKTIDIPEMCLFLVEHGHNTYSITLKDFVSILNKLVKKIKRKKTLIRSE